jgi:P-type conjugative transfer protein TrbJ
MRKPRAVVFALLVFVASLRPAPARADLFGGDVAALAAILAELIQQGITVMNQLRQLEAQVQLAKQTVKQLDPRGFNGISSLLDAYNNTRYTMQSITGQVKAIRYTIAEVNNDFNRLFPRDRNGWRGTSANQANARYDEWNSEITGASLVAMRAQTRLSDVEALNAQAALALASSRAADGEVRQLQALNQQLAIVQTQMSALIQLLSTGSRVTADLAASSAGEKMMTREAKSRRRENYKNKGAPPRKLTRLP